MKSLFTALSLCSLLSCSSESPLSSLPPSPPPGVFPAVAGDDLTGVPRQFPAAFTAPKTLVIVAFLHRQQADVDAWFRALEIEIRKGGVEYFELPTLPPMGSLREWLLYKGMQSGIPDPWMRQRVVTLHLDKSAFKQALGISCEDHVSVFVVGPGGRLAGSVQGALDETRLSQVKAWLQGSL